MKNEECQSQFSSPIQHKSNIPSLTK